MIRRLTLGAVLAAAAGSLVPGAALADHCDDPIVIFSGIAAVGGKVNSNAVLCIAAGEDLGDTRIINPASDEISLRFTQDFGAGVPEVTVILDGLGFDNQAVTLLREEINAGTPAAAFVYDSADLALDPTEVGCITAELTEDFGGPDGGATAFHTVGASC